MRILILFDGSQNAFRAVDFVKRWGRSAQGLEVTLLQVVEFWETGAWGFLTLPEEEQRRIIAHAKDEAEKGLARARAGLAEIGIDAATAVLVGEPASSILDYAENMKPDAIVLGSRGKGALQELVLGGICLKILELSRFTVIVVK